MPTQAELLEEQRMADLKELAKEYDVDLEGATKKDEIIDKLVATKKVTKAELEERFGSEGDEAPATVPTGERTPSGTQAKTSLVPADRESRTRPTPLGADEEAAARERVAGATSDAKTRVEGTTAAEVGTDQNVGPKPSDGGPEAYPFPPQGDVEVLTVPTGAHQGEEQAPIPVGSWVRLAQHDEVPERLWGHIATVIDAPTVLCNCDWAPVTHEHPSPEAGITVRTRDEVGATINVPLEAIAEWSADGRHAVAPIG